MTPVRRNPRVLAWLAFALAVASVANLGLAIAGRALFPWPLEWMEGGSLSHALRIVHGEALYAAPTSEFIPYLYPPLAYLPMAGALALLGPGLPAARLASIACTAGTLALVARAGARASRTRLGGALAAGLFAIGFGYTGAFLDLARVDACFVLLLAAASERLLARRDGSALAWLALSAFAKQHGLLLFAATAAGLLVEDRARHARSVLANVAALFAAALALELATHGYFARYCIGLPLAHGAEFRPFVGFFLVDLGLYLPVLVLASGNYFARRRLRIFGFSALVASALIASALGRAHPGGYDNVRLPAFLLLCVVGAAPLARALHGRKLGLGVGALCALALQLAILWQAPSVHRPAARSAAAFRELLGALERCADGRSAVALDFAGLTATPFLHTMALSDLQLADGGLARAGTSALLSRLDSPDAPYAIAVGVSFPALERALERNYAICARVPAPPLATGYQPGFRERDAVIERVYARRFERVYAR